MVKNFSLLTRGDLGYTFRAKFLVLIVLLFSGLIYSTYANAEQDDSLQAVRRLIREGLYEDALRELDKFIAADWNKSAREMASAYYIRAKIFYEALEDEKAEESLLRVFQYLPDFEIEDPDQQFVYLAGRIRRETTARAGVAQNQSSRQEKTGRIEVKKTWDSGKEVIDSAHGFHVYLDGTVLDSMRGLMWLAKDNGSDISWQDAKKYCANLSFAGYSDWRLPSAEELASLCDQSFPPRSVACDPALSARFNPFINATCTAFWADELRGREDSIAAFYDISLRMKGWIANNTSGGIRVLAVRDHVKTKR